MHLHDSGRQQIGSLGRWPSFPHWIRQRNIKCEVIFGMNASGGPDDGGGDDVAFVYFLYNMHSILL